MWATISTEGTDSFDALSRSYAYVFQRPLHYLFYAFVAGLIGWLGWLLVENFAAGVIWMGYWAAGWGSGSERIGAIMGGSAELSGVGYAGTMLVHFFAGCVKLLAVGYLFSYFWTAAVAIYFLLAATSTPPRWTKFSSTPMPTSRLRACPRSQPTRLAGRWPSRRSDRLRVAVALPPLFGRIGVAVQLPPQQSHSDRNPVFFNGTVGESFGEC